ncbi:MAG: bifunctional YncE family protein/alkaline phosphatase family protein [Bryobacteraceae bacterium]|jgi:YVTN family beta-propeller protein
MTREVHKRFALRAAGLMLALVVSSALAIAQPVPNMGQTLTPLAPPGSQFVTLNPHLADNPDWLASQAMSTAVSPDHKTLLVLTSGYNRVYILGVPAPPYPWYGPDSNEYVFVYDISNPTPVFRQAVQIPNTYSGIVFDPSGTHFYVAGGENDNVHTVTLTGGTWVEELPAKLAMNHRLGIGLNIQPNGALAVNSQVGVYPCAAGVAISNDGQTLVVANYYNDSITVFTGGYGNWAMTTANLDLRPGYSATNPQTGVAGGEYPFWVAIKGNGSTAVAYVSSIRDREIDVVNLGATPVVAHRIKVKGQPNKMTLNAAQSLLYVAEDQSDTVDVIDTATNAIVQTIPVVAAALPSSLTQPGYKGANPNSVALSPDETELYITNGTLNCVSVIALTGANSGQVKGLIPTGWYPTSISLVNFGGQVYAYVSNAKSPTGANPEWCYGGYGPPNSPNCNPTNEYNPQRTKAGLQSFPLPTDLASLTAQVAVNDRFSYTVSPSDAAVMAAVRQGIQHVIFIIKENRTYDQILGDLGQGDGDPTLTEFGVNITPNLHALAKQFVTLDRFMDTAEVSYDGWVWSTAAQAPDTVEHQYSVVYAYRGLSLDINGVNRNVNVALSNVAPAAGVPSPRQAADPFTSTDPNVLPGLADVGAPDGPGNEIDTGYLWNAALRAGLTVRNYGCMLDTTRYGTNDFVIPVLRNPFATGTRVAYPSDAKLNLLTDPYFRGFDNSLPDYWRYTEWARDFDSRYADQHHAGRGMETPPSLMLVRLMHDHTGNYSVALDGVNTPDLEVADNDYAVGLLVAKISKSPYANDTLIFVIEDDAQDGGDHVDAHRSTAFVIGAYVKRGAVVSTPYNTISLLRTIEEVLGIPQINETLGLPPFMNMNDALARPMADIFDTTPHPWSFTAVPAPILYNSSLPLPPKPVGLVVPKPTHNAKYWARVTKGMNFTDADLLDSTLFNRILWKGMMGDKPYPPGLRKATAEAKKDKD